MWMQVSCMYDMSYVECSVDRFAHFTAAVTVDHTCVLLLYLENNSDSTDRESDREEEPEAEPGRWSSSSEKEGEDTAQDSEDDEGDGDAGKVVMLCMYDMSYVECSVDRFAHFTAAVTVGHTCFLLLYIICNVKLSLNDNFTLQII